MPDLHPSLAGRWSPRAFDSRHEVDQAEVSALLEAARWAPSAGNGQPWRFAVGRRDDDVHKRIFACLDDEEQRWAWRASALIVAAYATDGHATHGHAAHGHANDGHATHRHAIDRHATDGRQGGESDRAGAAYDLGQAVAHLSVQATALCLHTRQMIGFDPARLRRELDLPGGVTPHTVVAVGRVGDPAVLPADLRRREFRLRERRPVRDLLLASAR